MDGNLNRVEKAYCDGLTSAITFVWEERSKHPSSSEAFVALTKVWEGLRSERGREETRGKPS